MTQLSCAGRVVAEYVTDPELAVVLSPRPYLHPVRTLAGVTVTDALPHDHPWHLGAGVALAHVRSPEGSFNFWGGRTYRPGAGYEWRDDHGWTEHVRWDRAGPDSFGEELAWRAPTGTVLLREYRTVTAEPLPASGWVLRLGFRLENVTAGPVLLGSPGTLGRTGGGYGGFFWRAAPSSGPVRVCTPGGTGETEVHGRAAPWLLFGGDEPGTGRPWSLLLAGLDAATAADPWFVRTGDYPGVGSALAYENPLTLEPGGGLSRSLLVAVLDGMVGAEQATAVLSAARGE